ncbi:gluconokinase [Desertibacillus haloalkaliphilus]|uniref:gluconokinase n=1 Tax=Desertibacillus haloalkaliphilus TaxID=1328930 RepID=UPI001C25BD46|nr:gluconokinase [Desertibacillus haloalkaliphilus]MBU8906349.1 gluconokinase [Desertibacillus haloalkaliphilus]
MLRELVIGLDLGTTSVKAVLFDRNGTLVCESEQMISTYYPNPTWVEQDPVEIEKASRLTVKEVMAKGDVKQGELLTIGISCAMHSLICVSDDYQPLSQMLIWADGRSGKQVDKLKQTIGKDIYARTGTPIHPMSPFVKLLWMKETNYKPYQEATYFMSMKEFLLQKWFNQRVVDYSMASASGLFNLQTYRWDEEAMEAAGVGKEQLSDVVPPTYVLTGLNDAIAEEIGITSDVPVVIGAADGQLANLGSGAIAKGEVAVSAGTSGAIRQVMQGAKTNEKQETFTYAFTGDTAIIGGATNNGGIALQWLKDLLAFEGSHEELLEGVEDVDIGAEGVIFHPYVNGERAPLWNQHAKGNFYGLSMGHKREHLVRAVLEGITFNIYQIGQSLEQIAGKPTKISVNGGLTKSPLWVQIMADMFGQEIYLSDTHHNAAWGAAWTALVGIKKADSLEAIKEKLPSETVVQPNLDNHAKYKALYEKYEDIGTFLAKSFE